MININKKNFSILIILLVFLIQGNLAKSFAQSAAIQISEQNLQTDQTNLKVKPVPHKKIENFRNDNAFKYEQVNLPGIDFWALFWYWINKIIGAIFSNEGVAPYIRYDFPGYSPETKKLKEKMVSNMQKKIFISKIWMKN